MNITHNKSWRQTVRASVCLLTCLTLSILSFLHPSHANATAGETILRIHGSNTIGAKLMPDLVKLFLKKKGYQLITRENGAKEEECFIVGVKDEKIHNIEIRSHGSSTSFAGLKAGICDIGMASRRIKGEEAKLLSSLGDMTDLENEHILAIDGIAAIVNKGNPVRELDLKQLGQIFSGQITNWADVGGKDAPIQVYARNNNSGTYDTFKSLVLKKTPLVKSARRYESNEVLSGDVSQDPNGIGFTSMSYVNQSKALDIKATQDTAGIKATNFTVSCEDYPLARRLYLYLPASLKNPLAREFVDYALSREGQNRTAMMGFSKLTTDMDNFEINTSRFKSQAQNLRYKKETMGGRRVNFNFRFTDAGVFENRSQTDLVRLVNYLKQPDQQYYELLLIGLNACSHAQNIEKKVIEKIGAEKFYIPPHTICLDNVATPGGTPWKPVIEVWLRTVDDGA